MTAPREQLSTADMVQPVPRQAADQPEVERPADTDGRTPLFGGTDAEKFRSRWSDIQASFVDEPRSSVQQADALVAEVMQQLAKTFADERSSLERQWDSGTDTDTEALRLALRRYRSFFDRLLSM
jgi:hypothetical protein